MNKCFIQFWAESEINKPIRFDGCSFHLNETDYKEYLESIYLKRDNFVPDIYDRKFGEVMECFIDDDMFDELKNKKSIKITESSKNNLLKSEKIIFKPI